jgi:outer membrane beta-barrel protein
MRHERDFLKLGLSRIFVPTVGALVMGAITISSAVTAEAAPARKRAPVPRDVKVDQVKEAYWNRTAEGNIEVVQNRRYTKKNRISLQASIGTSSTDPFLSVKPVSGALGFHFSESLGINAVYRKFLVGDSSYYKEMQRGLTLGAPSGANTNRPDTFIGGEIEYSPFYGKISLSGASIVHYDFHFLAGAGVTDTVSGKYFTPTLGFGPQIYLNDSFAFRIDYRIARYKETVLETVQPLLRSVAGERTNYSHSGSLGFVFFL